MSDTAKVFPCEAHGSLLWMQEWPRVVDIATGCPECAVLDVGDQVRVGRGTVVWRIVEWFGPEADMARLERVDRADVHTSVGVEGLVLA